MSGVLVDSNVLLDVLTEDPGWFGWSSEKLAGCADAGPLAINPIIYAEVSIRFEDIAELEEVLPASVFERLPLPWEAAFLAGKCFFHYRRSKGIRRSPLPDFYIGAHAAVAGLTLLTRDAARYRTYFPTLHLIAPWSVVLLADDGGPAPTGALEHYPSAELRSGRDTDVAGRECSASVSAGRRDRRRGRIRPRRP